jgi:hypothetical protein
MIVSKRSARLVLHARTIAAAIAAMAMEGTMAAEVVAVAIGIEIATGVSAGN